jgi:hypothetical protein
MFENSYLLPVDELENLIDVVEYVSRYASESFISNI